MDQAKPSEEKPSNPLIPVKSIMEWKPPSETVAAIVNLTSDGDQATRLQQYKMLCGKDT